jgi:RimJ/RimL family protein N-acetyltransferase
MPSARLSQLTYRKLHIGDHKAFEAHLLALNPECRRTRFGMATTDAFLTQYADRCFTLNAVLHGAFVGDILIGVAELRPMGEFFADEAEVAFSVNQDWRNCGVGTELFARTLRSARNRGYHKLYMTCLKYNAPMRHLARKFSAEIMVEMDESVALVETPRRTMISLMREAIDDASAFATQALDWQKKAFARRVEPLGQNEESRVARH